MTSIEAAKPLPTTKAIDIKFNGKDVRLRGSQHNGLAIKQAAITQGVPIQLDFQLSLRVGKRWQVIGDNETITVAQRAEFRAVDGDDNS